jgi:hypothetical protein
MCSINIDNYIADMAQDTGKATAEDIVLFVDNAAVNFNISIRQACEAHNISVEEYNSARERIISNSHIV